MDQLEHDFVGGGDIIAIAKDQTPSETGVATILRF